MGFGIMDFRIVEEFLQRLGKISGVLIHSIFLKILRTNLLNYSSSLLSEMDESKKKERFKKHILSKKDKMQLPLL